MILKKDMGVFSQILRKLLQGLKQFSASKIQVCLTLFFIVTIIMSCKHNNTPKPYGYFRIDLPKKEYQSYDTACPFTFEFPKYGVIKKDIDKDEYCWFNLFFKDFNATIYLSYKTVNNNLDSYTEDSRKFVYKHAIKAESIQEKLFTDPAKNVYGILYEIEGNAASSTQFYVTDSSEHFLRGALYFNNAPNKDSLAPVIKYFREDISHLIETLEWK